MDYQETSTLVNNVLEKPDGLTLRQARRKLTTFAGRNKESTEPSIMDEVKTISVVTSKIQKGGYKKHDADPWKKHADSIIKAVSSTEQPQHNPKSDFNETMAAFARERNISARDGLKKALHNASSQQEEQEVEVAKHEAGHITESFSQEREEKKQACGKQFDVLCDVSTKFSAWNEKETTKAQQRLGDCARRQQKAHIVSDFAGQHADQCKDHLQTITDKARKLGVHGNITDTLRCAQTDADLEKGVDSAKNSINNVGSGVFGRNKKHIAAANSAVDSYVSELSDFSKNHGHDSFGELQAFLSSDNDYASIAPGNGKKHAQRIADELEGKNSYLEGETIESLVENGGRGAREFFRDNVNYSRDSRSNEAATLITTDQHAILNAVCSTSTYGVDYRNCDNTGLTVSDLKKGLNLKGISKAKAAAEKAIDKHYDQQQASLNTDAFDPLKEHITGHASDYDAATQALKDDVPDDTEGLDAQTTSLNAHTNKIKKTSQEMDNLYRQGVRDLSQQRSTATKTPISWSDSEECPANSLIAQKVEIL